MVCMYFPSLRLRVRLKSWNGCCRQLHEGEIDARVTILRKPMETESGRRVGRDVCCERGTIIFCQIFLSNPNLSINTVDTWKLF
jgi:hypothetical protein